MNILVLGSGGREHAMAWKIKQSSRCETLYVAPGNAGTAGVAVNVALDVNDFEGIADFVCEKQIDLVVVGPEDPLVNGVVDYFKANPATKDVLVVGPSKAGAQLEGSKDFSKVFMQKHNIPTAGYATFTNSQVEKGLAYLDGRPGPYVLKADGLAAGKGVLITEDREEAKSILKSMLVDQQFGEASSKVVIEDFLDGIELSVFAMTDGKDYVLLPEAKDYKRIGEGDTGLNTGGMGALSPVPFADEVFMEKIRTRIVEPTIAGIAKDELDFKGFVFFGLIKVGDEPFVIEYNVRMGDPETEVVLPRLASDFVDLLEATAQGSLAGKKAEFTTDAASTVVLVSGGYPGSYAKGHEISGLAQVKNVIPFHAGTKLQHGKVVSNGGRVIAVSALGSDIFDALEKSNQGAETITWTDRNYRTDIGFDLKTLV